MDLLWHGRMPHDDLMLELLAGLLVLLATVFSFGLFLGKRCVAWSAEVVSEDQDNLFLTKGTEASQCQVWES